MATATVTSGSGDADESDGASGRAPVGAAVRWPGRARQMLAALDGRGAPPAAVVERRRAPRARYSVPATVRLSDASAGPVPTVYVRDVNRWGAGFIVGVRLPVRGKAVVTLAAPQGATVTAACVIRRCREYAPGWFEGTLEFDAEQPALAAEMIWASGVVGPGTTAAA